MGLLRPRHYLGTRKGQLSGSRESGSSEDPSPAGRVTVPLVTQKLSKLVRNVSLGFSYSFLSQEMCTHRQSAWHLTAVSKENLHRDGILVPVDLFLIFPVTALPMNGTSCLSFARGIKKKKIWSSAVLLGRRLQNKNKLCGNKQLMAHLEIQRDRNWKEDFRSQYNRFRDLEVENQHFREISISLQPAVIKKKKKKT